MVTEVLLVFSFVFFVIGAFSPSLPPALNRFSFISAGLATWVLTLILKFS